MSKENKPKPKVDLKKGNPSTGFKFQRIEAENEPMKVKLLPEDEIKMSKEEPAKLYGSPATLVNKAHPLYKKGKPSMSYAAAKKKDNLNEVSYFGSDSANYQTTLKNRSQNNPSGYFEFDNQDGRGSQLYDKKYYNKSDDQKTISLNPGYSFKSGLLTRKDT
mgnify:CR=1 FL=1